MLLENNYIYVMKYIKRFNESKEDDFKEEAENLLSYYIDENKAVVTIIENSNGYRNIYISTEQWARWGDCKEDLISYITYINSKYEFDMIEGREKGKNIGNIRFAVRDDEYDDTTYYRMMSDIESLSDELYFYEIFFKVKLY